MNHLATKLWGIITIEIKFGTRKSLQMVNAKDKCILTAAELRRRAEKLLKTKIDETIPPQVDDEPSRLLHELQVHQIELEMQNAELLQSRDKLEIALGNYSDLYDFAPVGYLTLDRKGVIRTTNLTGSGLIGIERARLLGQRFVALLPNDARPYFSEFLENVIARQGKGSCEMTLASEGIDPRIVQIEASAVLEKECRIALIDITARKRAEESLRESETRYQSLFENILNGFAFCRMLFDDQGRPADFVYLEVNGAFSSLTGLEDVTGKKVTEAIPGIKESNPELFEVYGRVALTGKPEKIETEIEPLGKQFTIQVYSPKKGYFVAVFDDITERKRLEAYREMGREILQILNEPGDIKETIEHILAELRMRAVFDAVGIRLQEGDDFPYYVQEGFPKDFLQMENTLIRRSTPDGVCRNEDGSFSLECTCGLVISGKADPAHPLFSPWGSFWTNDSLPLLNIPPDEEPRLHPRNLCIDQGYASVALVPIREADRNIGLIQFNARRKGCFSSETVEILEGIAAHIGSALLRKQAEEALAEKRKKLEELNGILEDRVNQAVNEVRQKDQMLILQGRQAAMGEMINNIAHQWRQPLNTLGLLMQGLPLFYDSDEFNREYLEENTNQCMELIQHMSRTIDDFRNFFKPDKEAVSFSVSQVIEDTLTLIENSFKAEKISIAYHKEGNPILTGFPNEYSQVLLNIMMNARDVLTENRVDDALISIRTFTEGGRSVVTITDNGVGIPDEIIDKLFDPYFTTKGPDKGTGIGLFMSKTIIEKNMGGRLTVRNTGQGAEFRIEI
jgi:PAS domain S-box-containing protein